ncbi:3-methyladenine DNA glycosylase AlkD [Alkalibacterium subtropicum]|uniref:3-methyladenine DNA glycosylase AlkD n=1 Tax=Alkalibacterium subtropicum TaxID=753702 RepID=A0A1I1L410_9LACT|nr:DNA alkylation repair protein [Alkalibacterium subtropicum]SFC64330.1 3-methyladenine DNA glycosylase AlkD [Alkalibacterium subtropicum]
MDGLSLLKDLTENRDDARADQMEAYMRDQFVFLGIPAEKRRKLMRPYFKEARKEKHIDWTFVDNYWEQPYRECQYIVCDYLSAEQARLVPADIDKLKTLVLKKAWWDTCDSLDKVIGKLALDYPELNEILLEWSQDEKIWLRRIAIDHQRHRKERTDTQLLETILKNNFGSSEFFINKAIGWILRDYSKTDPQWVTQFIEQHKAELHPLSIREGYKYLKSKNIKR